MANVTSGGVHGTVQKIDTESAFTPSAKTYHALTIKLDNNATIGRIKTWQPAPFTRETSHVYELNVDSFGRPVDLIPGVATGFTIAFSRVELWLNEIEVALGLTDPSAIWADLTDQRRPFTIVEDLQRGGANGPIPYHQWKYLGCWFQDRNEDAADAQGTAIYTCNATVAYIQRFLVF